MNVITVGKSYIDIDGYASAIAYRELLNMQGIDAKFVSEAVLNYSITKSLQTIPYRLDSYNINQDDKFIILDLSNKDYFPDFVKEDNIIEIVDHHPGFEDYWNSKLGNKSKIETIGSVATVIVEKYEQANLLSKMNIDIAKLLMAAILDNTLNFTANITNSRDIIAYEKLQKLTNIYDYAETYFKEVQESIELNLNEAIKNDIKIQHVNEYLPDVFGQLTIWDSNMLLAKYDILKSIMNGYGMKWMMNLISLKDNTSYVIYSDNDVRIKLEELLNCCVGSASLLLKPAMLRKEIMKKAIQKDVEKNIKQI